MAQGGESWGVAIFGFMDCTGSTAAISGIGSAANADAAGGGSTSGAAASGFFAGDSASNEAEA